MTLALYEHTGSAGRRDCVERKIKIVGDVDARPMLSDRYNHIKRATR